MSLYQAEIDAERQRWLLKNTNAVMQSNKPHSSELITHHLRAYQPSSLRGTQIPRHLGGFTTLRLPLTLPWPPHHEERIRSHLGGAFAPLVARVTSIGVPGELEERFVGVLFVQRLAHRGCFHPALQIKVVCLLDTNVHEKSCNTTIPVGRVDS